MDGSSFGLGTRIQKFSAIGDDGVVTMRNIEEPGAFEVSNAENMLRPLQGLLSSSNNQGASTVVSSQASDLIEVSARML